MSFLLLLRPQIAHMTSQPFYIKSLEFGFLMNRLCPTPRRTHSSSLEEFGFFSPHVVRGYERGEGAVVAKIMAGWVDDRGGSRSKRPMGICGCPKMRSATRRIKIASLLGAHFLKTISQQG